jgi:hypothetical protein
LRFRLAKPTDFQAAQSFVPRAYRYSPEVLGMLPDLWAKLHGNGELISAVVEDSTAAPGQQVRGVGLSVFIEDDFADQLLARPSPYVNARLHEMLIAGESPILCAREIARRNANGGLTLLPLHFCTASVNIEDQDVLRTLSAAQELFRVMHAGFKVKRVIKDVVNLDLCRFMQSVGMQLACDYASQFPALGLDSVPESERPYLLAIRHDEMPLGSAMSMMFLVAPVRFRFSPAEQRVLLCSLLRVTDADIAADLGLSPDTVRKHWKSITQRVLEVDPHFFPENEDAGNGENGRGRQKRRHLLNYVQMHMEELRPH